MLKRRKNVYQHVAVVLSIILWGIFSHSFKDVRKYYKSMVYVSSFNGIYYYLCQRHLVWEFIPSGIHWMIIRLIHVFIVTPVITLIFLSKLPSELNRQIVYLIKWVIIASIVEYLAYKKKLILYAHGWNIFWSGLIYLKMFVCSYLFTKRPVTTLYLSFCCCVFFVVKFKVPLKMKHYSKYFEPLIDIYYHTSLESRLNNIKRKML